MFSRLTHIWGKNTANKYPIIRDMLTIYFNGEHDDFGDTIDEIVDSYFDYNTFSRIDAENEIATLLKIEDEKELNALMEKIADNRFHPAPWGETWRSFLEKVYNHFER